MYDYSSHHQHRTRLVHVHLTHIVGLPTLYWFNVGPASQPIAVSMPVNRTSRWPNIETELGDCPVFALTAIRRTYVLPPKRHYPDNMIHWSNCEIMVGHRLRRWANIISTFRLLITNIFMIFFSEDLYCTCS